MSTQNSTYCILRAFVCICVHSSTNAKNLSIMCFAERATMFRKLSGKGAACIQLDHAYLIVHLRFPPESARDSKRMSHSHAPVHSFYSLHSCHWKLHIILIITKLISLLLNIWVKYLEKKYVCKLINNSFSY